MSFIRTRFPRLYRATAWVALLAMLVPMFVMLAHQPAMAQAAVHICGAEQSNTGGHDKAPAHKLPACPVCQSLHLLGGGSVPPDAVAVAAVSFVAFAPVISVSDFVPASASTLLPPARAPPVSA